MPSAVEVLFRVGGVQEVMRAANDVSNALKRIGGDEVRGAERAGRASVKSTASALKEQERLHNQYNAVVLREIKQQEREQARADARSAKQSVKSTNESLRAKVSAAREEARIRNQINALELREYQKHVAEKARIDQKASRDSERRARSGAGVGAGILGRGVGRVVGIGGAIAGTVGAIGGGFAIADALQGGIANQQAAGQIVRSSANTGGINKDAVLSAAGSAALLTGGTKADALAGLDAFIKKTGDLGAAVDMLTQLSQVAAASGASLEDMSLTAAEAFNVTGNKAESMQAIMSLAGQGRTGAIDIRDLGEYGARLTSGAALFSGGLANNIETMGAFAQIAKRTGGASSARVATEAVAALPRDIIEHEDDFKKAGIKTRAADGLLRAPEEILMDRLRQKKGDVGAFTGLLGAESGMIARGLSVAYSRGYTLQQGPNAGQKVYGDQAMQSMVGELKGAKLDMSKDVLPAVADKMTETQSKLNVAMEHFHETINSRLMPALPALIEKLSALTPAIGGLIDWITAHPGGAIAAVIGASISAEIAKAGLAKIVESGFEKALGATGAAKGGAAGTVGALLAITATSVAITAAGVTIIDKMADDAADRQKKRLAGEIDTGNVISSMRGNLPGASDDARKKLASIREQIAMGQKYNDDESASEWYGGHLAKSAVGYITGGKSDFSKEEDAANNLDSIKKQAAELAAALGEATGALGTFAQQAGQGITSPTAPARGTPQGH